MPSKTPHIALVLGDPAGIGPELVAKLCADSKNLKEASVLLIADRDEVEEGMRIAGRRFDYRLVNDPAETSHEAGQILLYDYRGDARAPFEREKATANGGQYQLDTLKLSLDLAKRGVVDGICYAPLNKSSLHQAGMVQSDELHFFVDELKHEGLFSEVNHLAGFWTSRVTSHVALKDVSALITPERVADAVALIYNQLRRAGVAEPRIAVCGLNPHNGDGGAFGTEETDVIEPGIRLANERGTPCTGPYPADTFFVTQRQNFDALVTMYHDQGQIAMKLLGFWEGVTVNGGLKIPIVTPAHGTAFDIYGQGTAKVGPMETAFHIARKFCSFPVN
jgi:4-hydroxy-L-threonine phosphate dehydrogenase PdxA